MATYEFYCRACEKPYDVYTNGPIKAEHRLCPECGSANTRQRFWSAFQYFLGGAPGGDPVRGLSTNRFG